MSRNSTFSFGDSRISKALMHSFTALIRPRRLWRALRISSSRSVNPLSTFSPSNLTHGYGNGYGGLHRWSALTHYPAHHS